MTSDRQSNPEEAGVPQVTTPMQLGEAQWIMNAINRLDDRVTQNAESQDERLRSVENTISSFKGWLAAIGIGLALLQIVALLAYRFLDISLK